MHNLILTENIEQNNLKLIKVNEGYIVISNTELIKENDFYTCKHKGKSIDVGFGIAEQRIIISKFSNNRNLCKDCNKIIFATADLNLEGIEIIEEKDNLHVNGLAERLTAEKYKETNSEFATTYYNGIIDGYEQVQKDLYTKEQVEKAIQLAQTVDYDTDPYTILRDFKMRNKNEIFEIINKTKVEIDLINNKCKFI